MQVHSTDILVWSEHTRIDACDHLLKAIIGIFFSIHLFSWSVFGTIGLFDCHQTKQGSLVPTTTSMWSVNIDQSRYSRSQWVLTKSGQGCLGNPLSWVYFSWCPKQALIALYLEHRFPPDHMGQAYVKWTGLTSKNICLPIWTIHFSIYLCAALEFLFDLACLQLHHQNPCPGALGEQMGLLRCCLLVPWKSAQRWQASLLVFHLAFRCSTVFFSGMTVKFFSDCCNGFSHLIEVLTITSAISFCFRITVSETMEFTLYCMLQ